MCGSNTSAASSASILILRYFSHAALLVLRIIGTWMPVLVSSSITPAFLSFRNGLMDGCGEDLDY